MKMIDFLEMASISASFIFETKNFAYCDVTSTGELSNSSDIDSESRKPVQ